MAETAEKQEKKLEPRSEIQEVGPCKLKVSIEVTAEKVGEQIDDKYKDLNDKMALPGFRKGHAPRALLERKFGKEVMENLKYELVNGSFTEVREEKKLETLGEPEIDVEKLALEPGKPFAYEVTVEVRPTIELGEYTGIKVKKPAVTVSPEEVDKVIRNFREARAELVPAPDATAQRDDQVICDFELEREGKSIQSAENNELFVNEHVAFFGQALKDFHTVLEGKRVGDSVEYPLTLPEKYPDKEHAGKEATLRAALKSVKRKDLPEVDASFAKAFDCDTVEELREYLEKRIHREKEEDNRQGMADEIVEELIRRHDFPMPEGLVQSGTEEALQRARLQMMMRGGGEEDVEKKIEELKTESRENIVRLLKANFLLDHIAGKERIFVTEEQVEDRIQKLAAANGVWPHELKAKLEADNMLPQLRRQMRHEQVREFLLSKAQVEE